MDRLWSPWRARHIERMSTAPPGATEAPSVFSRLASEDADEANLILWRTPHLFVLMNRYPYNNGHLLIVPNREVAAYEALTPEEQAAVATAIDRCIRVLKHALSPTGFNVGINQGSAAGAGIPQHLHVHIVPRWEGDTNFMPVVGGTKVIPEALDVTYRRLKAAHEALG